MNAERTIECPSCALESPAGEDTCPYCGYEFPRMQTSVKWVAVVMALLLLWPVIRLIQWLF